MEYLEINTDLKEVDETVIDNLVITGSVAWDYFTGNKEVEENDRILAYWTGDCDELETEYNLPEGDQELYIICDDHPTSFPYGDFNIADIDTVLSDFRKSDPYDFEERMQDEFERNLTEDFASEEVEQEIRELYPCDENQG